MTQLNCFTCPLENSRIKPFNNHEPPVWMMEVVATENIADSVENLMDFDGDTVEEPQFFVYTILVQTDFQRCQLGFLNNSRQ